SAREETMRKKPLVRRFLRAWPRHQHGGLRGRTGGKREVPEGSIFISTGADGTAEDTAKAGNRHEENTLGPGRKLAVQDERGPLLEHAAGRRKSQRVRNLPQHSALEQRSEPQPRKTDAQKRTFHGSAARGKSGAGKPPRQPLCRRRTRPPSREDEKVPVLDGTADAGFTRPVIILVDLDTGRPGGQA